MNILVNGLPNAIEIEDTPYKINADYQTGLKIIMAFEDNSLTQLEKQSVLLNLLYKEIPSNIGAALQKGIQYLNCGDTEQSKNKGIEQRVYSFTYDQKYIFSAVDRVLYGRLSKGEFVHWWEFVMAFMDMPEDCMMSKIIYYRTQFQKGKLTKEERKIYFDNRSMFELPAELTNEEELKKERFLMLLEK